MLHLCEHVNHHLSKCLQEGRTASSSVPWGDALAGVPGSRCLGHMPRWARQAQRRQRSVGPPSVHPPRSKAHGCMLGSRTGSGIALTALLAELL